MWCGAVWCGVVWSVTVCCDRMYVCAAAPPPSLPEPPRLPCLVFIDV